MCVSFFVQKLTERTHSKHKSQGTIRNIYHLPIKSVMNLSTATLRHLCHTCNSKNFLCAECIVRGEEEQEQKQNDRRRHPRHQQMRTLSSSLFDHRFQGDVQDRVVNIGSVQREEDCSFPNDLRKINDEGAPKQNKKLLDSMIVIGKITIC